MAKPLDVEQVDALIEKNRALVARERERVNELKTQNADTLQEICTSLIVPASAFGMSYAQAYFGERASIGGISIDSCVGLLMHAVGALFDLSASKGGQRVGKLFHDIANGAFASWTARLGTEYGAKKRLETPLPLPPPQPSVGSTHAMPKPTSGPMTFEELAAITGARLEPPVVATQETPKPASSPTIFENIAAMTTAMLMTPRAPHQSAPTPTQVPAPQPATGTTKAPTTAPRTPQQPPPGAQPTPAANPQKPYRFAQSRAAPLRDLGAAFTCGTYPMREVDDNLQWLSQRYSSENLASILNFGAAPA